VVAPFSSGDTPLQHYNMALTLATANEVADAVLLFDNDDLLAAARYRRRVVGASMAAYGLGGSSAGASGAGGGSGGTGLGGSASAVAAARAALRAERSGRAVEGRGVGTRELNDVAAEALAGLLLPTLHRGKRMLRPGYGSVTDAGAAAEGRGGGGGGDGSGGGGRRQRWVDVSREPTGGLFSSSGGSGSDGEGSDDDDEGAEAEGKEDGEVGRDSDDEDEEEDEGSAEGKRGRGGATPARRGGGTTRFGGAGGSRPRGRGVEEGGCRDGEEEEEEGGGSGGDSWIRASVRGTYAGFGGRPATSAGAAAPGGAAGGSRVEAAMAALGRSDAADGSGGVAGASASAAAAAACVHYLDAAALVSELVPQPRLRYLDARSVSNMVAATAAGGSDARAGRSCGPSASAAGAGAGAGVLSVIPGLEWADLADRLTDVVPRYLARTGGSGGGRGGAGSAAGGEAAGPQRLVTTLAGRLYVRGARQLDCDSVDPTLPAPAAAGGSGGSGRSGSGGGVSSGGGGGGGRATTLSGEYPVGSALRPRTSGGAGGFGSGGAAGVTAGGIPGLWGGLPATEEWAVVSQKLLRGFNLAGRYGGAGSGLSSGYGYGARPGTAPAAPPVPLSALLTPQAGPLIGPAAAVPAGARSLTSIVNSDVATPRLLACVERVEQLLRLRAYLHWYERFGVGADHMQAAAESVLDTVDAYAAAAAAASGGGGARGGGSSGLSGVAGRR